MTTKIYYIPNISSLVYDNNSPNLKVENLPMNRFDVQFTKGSTNTLDFSIRSKDRKPVSLIDKMLRITISNIETGSVKSIKELEKLDLDKGYARLTLTNSETEQWDEGFYQYAVEVTEDNGREGFAFIDQVYNVAGKFELKGNAISPTADVTVITEFQLFNNINPYYLSGVIDIDGKHLNTVAWYLANFAGELIVQVSLNQTVPTNNNDWMDVATFDTESLTYTGISCIKYMNVEGNYSFLRVKFIPDTLNEGTVTKILVA